MNPEDCPVTPWRENHVWSSARKAVEKRDGNRCAWPKCPRRSGEVNHITPRLGEDINTVGCLHHLDGLETLCGPHHKRVTKWEQRIHRGLPLFRYPDDGWLPGDTVTSQEVARLMDTSPGNGYIQTTYWNFPDPVTGERTRIGHRSTTTRRWDTREVLEWACARGFLDEWDLHPDLSARLDRAAEPKAA